MRTGHWSDAYGERPPRPAEPERSPVPCATCGHDVSGRAVGEACPGCGVEIGRGPSGARVAGGMAIASLVLGVVSIIGFFVYGLVSVVCGPLAIYFARRAQAMEMRREAPRSSASMAQAGRVCGFVGTALGAVFLAVGVALFIAFLLGVRHRGLPWPIPFP